MWDFYLQYVGFSCPDQGSHSIPALEVQNLILDHQEVPKHFQYADVLS